MPSSSMPRIVTVAYSSPGLTSRSTLTRAALLPGLKIAIRCTRFSFAGATAFIAVRNPSVVVRI